MPSQTSVHNGVDATLQNRNDRFLFRLKCSVVLGLAAISGFSAENRPLSQPPTQLYRTTNIVEAHFHFTPDQWQAMPPEEGGGGMFGPGPGRGPGGPGGGFGPGMFLGPAFAHAADANKDQKISGREFAQLAERWFAEWDKKKAGALKEDELRDGLNTAIAPPEGGPPRMISLQGAQGKRNGLASAAGIEFKYVKGDLEIEGTRLRDVAVRYKGNGTWMGSRFDKKRSMKADLNEFVKGQKYAGEAKLNFHNCVTDPSYMNEVLSYALYRDAGVPASRTAYAKVFVDVPGEHSNEYFGVYSVVENVDTAFAEQRFGTKKGAIFKPVTQQPFDYLGDDWTAYNQTYDPKTDLTDQQKKRVVEFAKLVSKADDAEFNSRLAEYLDLENFSRYMAVTTWLATLDSILGIGQNYYVYLHPKTGKFMFIPWDLDHSFGQFFLVGSPEQREKLSIRKPWQGEIRFLDRVYKNPEFAKLYRTRLEEFSKTIFQPARFVKQVDDVAAAIRPAVKEESEGRLERFDKVVAGEPVPPGGFGPGPGGPGGGPGAPRGGDRPQFGPPGIMQPAKPIKGFVKVRAQSVIDQLAGKEPGEVLDAAFGRGGSRGGPRFGPGNFMAGGFLAKLDKDGNGQLSKQEFIDGFNAWFQSWDKDRSDALSEDQLRAGLNQTVAPPGGFPGPGAPTAAPLGNSRRPGRPPTQ